MSEENEDLKAAQEDFVNLFGQDFDHRHEVSKNYLPYFTEYFLTEYLRWKKELKEMENSSNIPDMQRFVIASFYDFNFYIKDLINKKFKSHQQAQILGLVFGRFLAALRYGFLSPAFILDRLNMPYTHKNPSKDAERLIETFVKSLIEFRWKKVLILDKQLEEDIKLNKKGKLTFFTATKKLIIKMLREHSLSREKKILLEKIKCILG